MSRPRALARVRERYRRLPWWARVLVVFAASRVVTTVILLAFAAVQARNPWTGPSPSYLDFAAIWDGDWYKRIALFGYPTTLPVDSSGHVAQNAWAFLPAYPALVRTITIATHSSFEVVALVVAVGFSIGTVLVLYRLMAIVLPSSTALFTVALFCFAPLSPILQVDYAESMALFFLALALLLLLRRSYWLTIPVVLVAALTRPLGLAFALALGLHVIHRFWRMRGGEPFPVRERVAAIVATLASGVWGLLWPVIAWAVTGSPSAYTDTELAWRASYIGYHDLLPFLPWIEGGNWWFQWFGFWPQSGVGAIAVGVLVALFALLMLTPAVRRLGVDLRLWVVAYVVYLLAVFFPQSSTFRLLMPLFPLLGAVALPRSRVYRAIVLVLCIAGQVGWVAIAWWIDGSDWTPP